VPWEALGPFVALIEFFRNIGERKDDRTRAALGALSQALTETRFYLRDRAKGAKPNQKSEDKIARLWAAAAVELRGLDSNLAMICQYKSDYWADPAGWTDVDVVDKCIQIDALFERYHKLLDLPGASLCA
jgi:hypothetical protein